MNFRDFFMPGINATVTGIAGWQKRAEFFVENETDGTADTLDYEENIFTRGFQQSKVADDAARCMMEHQTAMQRRGIPELLRVTTHSNGADILLRALDQARDLKVHRWHAVAAACEGNCQISGLNDMIARGQIDHVTWHFSSADEALKWPYRLGGFDWIKKLLGKDWVYGFAGLTGPSAMTELTASRTTLREYKKFKHSQYFEDPNFNLLLSEITTPELVLPTFDLNTYDHDQEAK